ncbi:putative surfeit locus protein 2 [Apostichopus japonicus]|uniref:Putative surfeit locus protein 2 n=1 Tax=Stichopus japonicus TaxID=307972 RepID=A0A2G8KM17_STIJA|nr:putative surfeit locus protein 2 [Apostichopus japonicus]
MDKVSSRLDDLMLQFPSLSFTEDGKKIKCDLTGHEMPPKVEVLQVYVAGKKFLKLHERQKYKFSQHQPHLVNREDKHHKNHLYCNLTHRFVNKLPEHVERHVKGRRYQTELKRYKECISDGTEYKSRRQPQKLIEESMAATEATDQEQLGIDFIPSDSEEDEGNNRSDESLTDLYPEGDFPAADEVPAGGSEDNCSTNESEKGQDKTNKIQKASTKKVMPRVNSSKSKMMRKRKFPSALHQTKGIKQPDKVTKRSKQHRQIQKK